MSNSTYLIPQARFEEFLTDIEPSKTTKTNSQNSHLELREFLKKDEDFKEYILSDFLSGSYKRQTAIRPRKKGNSLDRPDVDIVIVTNHTTDDSPKSVVDLLYNAIVRNNKNQKYSSIKRQNRSVGIEYYKADMDVVPLIKNDSTFLIPDRSQENWLETNPPGHTAWTTKMNNATNGKFKPLVKMIKWWRRQKPTISKRPKGFLIECITAENMDFSETYYGELFIKTLENIVDNYNYDILKKRVPAIKDPGLSYGFVTTGMTFDTFQGFYNKVKTHAKLGREALDTNSLAKANEIWKKIFVSRFPTTTSKNEENSLLEVVSPSSISFPDKPIIPNKPNGFA